MLKKIGIVGHKKNISIIENFIPRYFSNIEYISIPLTEPDDIQGVADELNLLNNNLDGVVFTGKIPYDIMNHEIATHVPWTYLEQNESQLLRTLLESTLIPDYDFTNISIDSYDSSQVRYIYNNIGLTDKDYTYLGSSVTIFDTDFLDKIEAFHQENYYKRNVSFCITGITSIHEKLLRNNIPALLLQPTDDIIRQAIINLELKVQSIHEENNHIAVIAIEIDYPSEYSLLKDDEYLLMLEKNEVSKDIYLFAQRIQSVVIENGSKNYFIYTTKEYVKIETLEMHEMPILSAVNQNSRHTISLGIGYGTSVKEAKYSAIKAMNISLKNGGNQAHIVYPDAIIGPIYDKCDKSTYPSPRQNKYQEIAIKSGLSFNTIHKLSKIKSYSRKDTFTSKELAKEYGNSYRSMNRLLIKLETAGYVEVIGKQVISNSGRPSRILKLLF